MQNMNTAWVYLMVVLLQNHFLYIHDVFYHRLYFSNNHSHKNVCIYNIKLYSNFTKRHWKYM